MHTVIDHTAFPDIIDTIFAVAGPTSLVALRAASIDFWNRADGILFKHVLLGSPNDRIGVELRAPTPPYQRLPFLPNAARLSRTKLSRHGREPVQCLPDLLKTDPPVLARCKLNLARIEVLDIHIITRNARVLVLPYVKPTVVRRSTDWRFLNQPEPQAISGPSWVDYWDLSCAARGSRLHAPRGGRYDIELDLPLGVAKLTLHIALSNVSSLHRFTSSPIFPSTLRHLVIVLHCGPDIDPSRASPDSTSDTSSDHDDDSLPDDHEHDLPAGLDGIVHIMDAHLRHKGKTTLVGAERMRTCCPDLGPCSDNTAIFQTQFESVLRDVLADGDMRAELKPRHIRLALESISYLTHEQWGAAVAAAGMAGVEDTFITYAQGRVGKAVKFDPCYFSSTDEEDD